MIVQFGGQTPLNIARALSDEGVKILGTSIDSIDIAEDRDLFRKMMDQLGIPMPESGMATSIDEALACVKQIGGYPVMIRPSFVLGGRGRRKTPAGVLVQFGGPPPLNTARAFRDREPKATRLNESCWREHMNVGVPC
ncbi:MAG: hypothetical protein PUK29_11990 [Fibrobacter sp.]|nr:hypothetical protein [Fibrobacter sp.]MDD7498966.1 hypothetical protein [Fibrobacter sp.]MDY5724752.1 hypothetical protein [Fibrobacter sp.]